MKISIQCATISLAILVVFSLVGVGLAKKLDTCEVCEKFITKFAETRMNMAAELRDDEVTLKNALIEVCLTATGKEERFCYAIGGREHSATSIVYSIIKPIKFVYPPQRICAIIKKNIPDICELKFDKPIDLSNLKKLKVKELKRLLADWGQIDACKGCLEKQDYIRVVEELLPVHAPQFVKPKTEL